MTQTTSEIASIVRGIGATVFEVRPMFGFPDLVIGYRNRNFLVRVTDGPLTAEEAAIVRGWQGHICIVPNADCLIAALGVRP